MYRIFNHTNDDVKGDMLPKTSIDSPFIKRSVKFEEGPLHVVSDHPVGDLLDETIEEGFDSHSSISDDDDEKVLSSDLEVDDQVMVSLEPLPVWAKKTMHDTGELVGNLVDLRRTRSQFFETPTKLNATENFFPINFYMSLAANP